MAGREEFEAFQELLFGELNEDLKQRGTPAAQRDRFNKCLSDNTTGGKLNRGLAVLTELFQAASEYRRGKLCWYRAEGVGLLAINDAHFRDHPEYVAFVELFNEAGFRTELGQLCDTSTACNNRTGDMTADQDRFIAANKTLFYSFYLPVALGLHYVQVLLEIGEYFQIQDDYLDVFGILILIQALCSCNTDQRQMLIDSYGKRDPAHERRVLQLSKEIQIEKTYSEFEERKLKELYEQIDGLDRRCGLEPGNFTSKCGPTTE
ncbi:isoprenoid synthase domain-containing protein [Aspergillus floccosus]